MGRHTKRHICLKSQRQKYSKPKHPERCNQDTQEEQTNEEEGAHEKQYEEEHQKTNK